MSIRVPLALIQRAEALGIERRTLVLGTGLTPRHLADPDGRVDRAALRTVWRNLLVHDPDPSLGLRIGRRSDARSLGVVGYAMASCRTLGDALRCLSRYCRILDEGFACDIESDVDGTRIIMRAPASTSPPVRQPIDARLAALLAIGRQLTDRRIVPCEVHLPYDRPRSIAEHRRTFGAAHFRFAHAEAALRLRATDLALVIPSADDTLRLYLDRLASAALEELREPHRGPFACQVAHAISSMPGPRAPDLESAGAFLGISPRTLQRRLRDEGTSFAMLLQRRRCEEAERLLRDPGLTVEQIATLVGYSEPSTFYRAFRRWRGASPGLYRATAPRRNGSGGRDLGTAGLTGA